jgi:hypothetical protein
MCLLDHRTTHSKKKKEKEKKRKKREAKKLPHHYTLP